MSITCHRDRPGIWLSFRMHFVLAFWTEKPENMPGCVTLCTVLYLFPSSRSSELILLLSVTAFCDSMLMFLFIDLLGRVTRSKATGSGRFEGFEPSSISATQ